VLIEWIVDSLKGRKFRVKVNGGYSRRQNVTSGIPQGSVLGPLLCLIYINDLMECCDESLTYMYLWMMQKIYGHIQCPDDCNLLQYALAGLQSWSQKWLLNLNTKKCCVVSYGRSVDKTVTYTLVDHSNQEAVPERYDKVKDLGMWSDEKLSFREHTQDKINKAYMMLGVIMRNFRHLTIRTFVLLYKTMVRSHLDYCCSVWAPYKKGDIILKH